MYHKIHGVNGSFEPGKNGKGLFNWCVWMTGANIFKIYTIDIEPIVEEWREGPMESYGRGGSFRRKIPLAPVVPKNKFLLEIKDSSIWDIFSGAGLRKITLRSGIDETDRCLFFLTRQSHVFRRNMEAVRILKEETTADVLNTKYTLEGIPELPAYRRHIIAVFNPGEKLKIAVMSGRDFGEIHEKGPDIVCTYEWTGSEMKIKEI